MSRLTTGVLGAIGISLVSGAAQFALGHDIGREPFLSLRRDVVAPTSQIARLHSRQTVSTGVESLSVDRRAKSDRAATLPAPAARTRTVSLQPDGISDTSYLLRVPDGNSSRTSTTPARLGGHKPIVACEPVVSVLAEIANQLQPGRCLT